MKYYVRINFRDFETCTSKKQVKEKTKNVEGFYEVLDEKGLKKLFEQCKIALAKQRYDIIETEFIGINNRD